MMLIAEAVPQRSDTSTSNLDLIGIYLCPATAVVGSGEHGDVMDLTMRMTPSQPTPNRKIVVAPPQGGTYPVLYGPILNPVEGDYSTGSIDSDNARSFNCNPEPRHCRWKYWESGLTKGDWLVPRFHCLQAFGEWWVVDVDRTHGLAQQVAALDFADNPEHNFGIHSRKEAALYATGDPDSEYTKVIQENLPRVG